MSNRRHRQPANTANQMQLPMTFAKRSEKHIASTREMVDSIYKKQRPEPESEMELGFRFILALKDAYKSADMSVDQLVDAINTLLHRSDAAADADPPTCKKPLTVPMMYNYLSKPIEYPMPAVILYAAQHVTGSLSPAAVFVESMGGKIATQEEVRMMALGKIYENIAELKQLEKSLKGARW